jgi:hypothetical protein
MSLFRVFVIGALMVAAAYGQRHRVIVSSDIGGTDPDDFQSMVHLLLYSDVLDIEGIVSSPYGPGRLEHIHQVIDRYAVDYPALKKASARYPTPARLKAISKQGALEAPGRAGFGSPTAGSEWIVRCARRRDSRPLYVLVWGGIEDLAQALHDAPDILPKLRVYFIGGPNKMWSVDAYHYVEREHPKLWMIESNATYRGWFTGGNQAGEWGNREFVRQRIAPFGALGEFFETQLKGTIKMGDSPSVSYLLHGDPSDPSKAGWGGQYQRIWDGRDSVFERLTTEEDQVEVFGVVEFALPLPVGFGAGDRVKVMFDRRVPAIVSVEEGVLRFRFSPRDAKVWSYSIESSFQGMDGWGGKFTAVPRSGVASLRHPNWWIDKVDPAVAEGVHPGAKTVNRWREEFLGDFAARMRRCGANPNPSSR